MAKTYKTIQHDAFDSAAYRLWGDSHLIRKLLAENVDYMDVFYFDPGIEINVPEIQKPAKKGKLPPWYAK